MPDFYPEISYERTTQHSKQVLGIWAELFLDFLALKILEED
jgi:hypothetical protein